MEQLDAGQVEPLQVVVALVLVDRLAERRQPRSPAGHAPACGQQLRDGQAGPVAAPVGDHGPRPVAAPASTSHASHGGSAWHLGS